MAAGMAAGKRFDYCKVMPVVENHITDLASRYYGETRHWFTPPVDLIALTNWLNVEVAQVPFRGRISGCLVYTTDDVCVIGVDKRDCATRQRFTIVHEIGHYVMDSAFEYRSAFFCSPMSSTMDFVEKRADLFAATLLMPGPWVVHLHQKGWSVEAMAEFFFVSKEAMRIRLHQVQRFYRLVA